MAARAEHALDLGIEKHALWRALALDGLLAVRIARAAGVREEVEARVLDHDRALEQLSQRAADLVDALAVEHELREAPVDVERALEAPVLGIDDPLQERGHQVDHLDVGGDRENRHVQPVGFGEHFGRQLAEVGVGPNHQAGAAAVCDPADEAHLRVAIVLDREPGREHEVAGSGLDLGRLHHPDPLDRAVEPFGARDELGVGEGAKPHRLADGGPGLGELGRGLLGHHLSVPAPRSAADSWHRRPEPRRGWREEERIAQMRDDAAPGPSTQASAP